MGSQSVKEYIQKKLDSKKQCKSIAEWLDSAAARAKQISFATHIAKYTHSESEASDVYYKKTESNDIIPYVTTDSLTTNHQDVAGNAAAHDVANLLLCNVDGKPLSSLIIQESFASLEPFADSPERLSMWVSGLKKAVVSENKKISAHKLKQLYWPVEEGYHLLAPLFASSLYQEIYEKIKIVKFGEGAKESREAKKKRQFSDKSCVEYPKLALQYFGGTKPQNISLLNNKRGGTVYLLRSAPPIWMKVDKYPKNKNDFWNNFKYRSHALLDEIKSFLISFQRRANNKASRDERQRYIDLLLDIFFDLSEQIRGFEKGWSYDSAITEAEKIWLDPNRSDFIEQQKEENWKIEISKHFARWVIDQLKPENDEYILADAEMDYLSDECFKYLQQESL